MRFEIKHQLLSFNTWWQRFAHLAEHAGFEVGSRWTYREYFEDGDAPEEALAEEMSRTEASA
jgi:hypothetical protein